MSQFQITQNQVQEFKTKGFLHLKNAVPAAMLTELQTALADLNNKALSSY